MKKLVYYHCKFTVLLQAKCCINNFGSSHSASAPGAPVWIMEGSKIQHVKHVGHRHVLARALHWLAWSSWRCTYRRMADSSNKFRLTRAKKGLVEGLTKLVHEAAGELVTDELIGLEESPR